jgi:hypothetical protein
MRVMVRDAHSTSWPSGLRLREESVPVWLASVAYLRARDFLGVIRFSEEAGEGSDAAEILAGELRSRRSVETRIAEDGRKAVLVPP